MLQWNVIGGDAWAHVVAIYFQHNLVNVSASPLRFVCRAKVGKFDAQALAATASRECPILGERLRWPVVLVNTAWSFPHCTSLICTLSSIGCRFGSFTFEQVRQAPLNVSVFTEEKVVQPKTRRTVERGKHFAVTSKAHHPFSKVLHNQRNTAVNVDQELELVVNNKISPTPVKFIFS